MVSLILKEGIVNVAFISIAFISVMSTKDNGCCLKLG